MTLKHNFKFGIKFHLNASHQTSGSTRGVRRGRSAPNVNFLRVQMWMRGTRIIRGPPGNELRDRRAPKIPSCGVLLQVGKNW